MSGALLFAAVCLAGGAGAVARFHVDRLVTSALRARFPAAGVPWGTLAVNVSGSFLLGLLIATAGAGAPGALLAVAGSGFCGGYTTFSTAVVEVVRSWGDGAPRRAVAHAAATLLGSVAAAAAGLALGGA
ncbi:CrcB protein [Kineococcus xinjiangensis]|uniref:Fluoride-specific ion channel FluC n=1 Tax=Kineococcus xinjiangensis TaxID=512762 RepID=A0A2S6IVH1_9ACTN|nr:CrcB family protein [Kineococcus xinjiangensis]PPK98189.1 CrcB protein [Kineococcus xinjiangensis]